MKPDHAFAGLPHAMRTFFFSIAADNSTDFFESHRSDYEQHVRTPLYALADALAPTVCALNPDMETRPVKVVSRIRRDTRFTKDKSPYRDHMWMSWFPAGKREMRTLAPAPYLSVYPQGWDVGMGFYCAQPRTMKAFRARLCAGASGFLSIVQEPAFASTFALQGEAYKRMPAGGDLVPEDLHPWYQKKNPFVTHTGQYGPLTDEAGFADEAARLITLLKPLYDDLMALPVDYDEER